MSSGNCSCTGRTLNSIAIFAEVHMPATQKAVFSITLFSIFAAWCAWSTVTDWSVSLPLVIFHLSLLVNTFFSIRCFSRIIPRRDWTQKAIDAILGVLYLALPLQFGQPLWYAVVLAILFTLATTKYALLFHLEEHLSLLYRKVFFDSLGSTACVLLIAATVAGYGVASAWAWAVVFILADIYLLVVDPLYVISSE